MTLVAVRVGALSKPGVEIGIGIMSRPWPSPCSASPSMKRRPRRPASAWPMVVLPQLATPITTTAPVKASEDRSDAAVDIENVSIDEG